jgi:hypothetical protein
VLELVEEGLKVDLSELVHRYSTASVSLEK